MIFIRNISGDIIHKLDKKDLCFAYLADLDLRSADFRGQDLCWACFAGSILDGADFRGADLRAACFDEGALDKAITDETTKMPIPKEEKPRKRPCWM